MLASDTIQKCNLYGYFCDGENSGEIKKLLLILKEKLPFIPKLICVDFAPAWIEAIKDVFPETDIQICNFHVMQLLNRALLKDLTRNKKSVFDKVIEDANQFRKGLLRNEKTGNKLLITSINPDLKLIQNNFGKFIKLLKENNPVQFNIRLHKLIELLRNNNSDLTQLLVNDLLNRIPKAGFTVKNLKKFKKDIYKAFRKNIRAFRIKIEEDKKEYSKTKFLLLTRPEKLSDKNKKNLENFMKKYPEFRKFRDLTLELGDILRLEPEIVTPNLILNLKIWSDAHNELKTALKTIQKFAPNILAYRNHVKNLEQLNMLKRIRTNPEYIMKNIEKIKRNHFGLRSEKNTELYFTTQLKCPITINI